MPFDVGFETVGNATVIVHDGAPVLATDHDEIVLIPIRNGLPDMATEPLLMAIRDTMPTTRAIAPLYRSPIVVNTKNGRVVEARSEDGNHDDD